MYKLAANDMRNSVPYQGRSDRAFEMAGLGAWADARGPDRAGSGLRRFVRYKDMNNYDDLKVEVQRLLAAGQLDRAPTREQRIDFAYGNSKLENEDVTREMAERAVDASDASDR